MRTINIIRDVDNRDMRRRPKAYIFEIITNCVTVM